MEKLSNPETGEIVHASRGTAERLREEGYEDVASGSSQDSEGSGEEVQEAPAKSATREEWDGYAESLGVDPEQFSSKDDLIEAIEAKDDE